MQEVAWSRVKRKSFDYLLSGPLRSRTVRRVEVNNLSPVMTQNDKYKQDAKPSGGYDKEIY